jgi:hypothetical protein
VLLLSWGGSWVNCLFLWGLILPFKLLLSLLRWCEFQQISPSSSCGNYGLRLVFTRRRSGVVVRQGGSRSQRHRSVRPRNPLATSSAPLCLSIFANPFQVPLGAVSKQTESPALSSFFLGSIRSGILNFYCFLHKPENSSSSTCVGTGRNWLCTSCFLEFFLDQRFAW